ncbi:MAG: hypothetical protein GXO76_12955 [Calditrichaeota bacterium]|nr:hypothetical protein [Calditrichota bacterium]
MRRLLLCFPVFLLLLSTGQAQIEVGANHPELHWMVFETDHFKIIYHQELKDVSREAAQIAENSFFSITHALKIIPKKKIVLVLQDTDDYSNGLSNPLGHVIHIWTPAMPKTTTGRLRWLRRVIAHELTHEIHFWGLRNFSGVWWELIGLGTTPDWFTEGLAQYEAETWDLHRDLLLRVSWWSQKLLQIKDLQGFVGTDPVDSRLVYEEGHSLVRYASRRWGDQFLPDFIAAHREFPLSFDWNLYHKTGLTERKLYRVWLDSLSQHYFRWKKGREFMSDVAKPFPTPFQGAYSIRWAPDGRRAAVVGIPHFDGWLPELRIFEEKSRTWRRIGGTDVHAQTSWSPDGTRLVYSRAHPGVSLSTTNDLFGFDFTRNREIQLTHNERATDPDFSPDGQSLVFVKHFPGRANLMMLNLKTGRTKQLTHFPLQTEVFSPRWAPDGREIAFSLVDSTGRRVVAAISPGGDSLRVLQNSGYDARSPEWSPDGTKLAYIDYRFGTPNLFVMNRDGSDSQPVTNAFGGLFNPNWSPDGKRIFVTVFERRDSIQIVSLPAERRVHPHYGPLQIPWTWQNRTFQRFPATRNSVSASAPKPYHAYRHLQSLIVLPALQKDDRGYEGGFIHLLADPLDKQILQSFLTVGDGRVSANFMYATTRFLPTLSVAMGQNYVNRGNYLGQPGLKFWDRQRELRLQAVLPFSFGKNLLSIHQMGAGVDIQHIEPMAPGKISALARPLQPFSGSVHSLDLFYLYRFQRPDLGNDIHPVTGLQCAVSYRWADRLIGSKLQYHEFQGQLAGHLLMPFRRDVLAVRAGGFWHQGGWISQAPPQISSNLVRGLTRTLEGTRQLTGTLEYRIQLIRNLRLYLLRLLYVERVTMAFFTDGGRAWGESTNSFLGKLSLSFRESTWHTTVGSEFRVRLWPLAKLPIVVRAGIGREIVPKKSWKIYFLFAPVF